MFTAIGAAIIPVLFTAALGYAWVRAGRPLDGAVLTPLVTEVGSPCLILATLLKAKIEPAAFASMALAAFIAITLFLTVGAIALRTFRLRIRTYLPSVAFPNAGNLGLPLSLYAFGPKGLAYAIVFFAFSQVGSFTIGQAIAAGRANWVVLARMPLIYAVALGVAASTLNLELPGWLRNFIALLGNMTVPLMLLMLGASIARLRVASLGRSLCVSGLRIGIGLAVGVGVSTALGMTGVPKAVLVMQCAMPVAIFSYVFAQQWGNDPEEVAGLVVVSTAATVFTAPLLLNFLLAM